MMSPCHAEPIRFAQGKLREASRRRGDRERSFAALRVTRWGQGDASRATARKTPVPDKPSECDTRGQGDASRATARVAPTFHVDPCGRPVHE